MDGTPSRGSSRPTRGSQPTGLCDLHCCKLLTLWQVVMQQRKTNSKTYLLEHCFHTCTHTPVAAAKSLQSCPTLCDPIDCSPPGSSVHGILQARTLEWVAISLSCIGEANGNPLQCSCLENPRDGGAWWVAVYGVTQRQTRLK